MKLEVSLSEEEVKQIIYDNLKKKFGWVGAITIDVGTECKSVGKDGRHVLYYGKFKAIKADVEV